MLQQISRRLTIYLGFLSVVTLFYFGNFVLCDFYPGHIGKLWQFASAQEEKTPVGKLKTPPVKAQLVAGVDALVPGQTVRLGLLLTQDEGWHTYYKEPGDAGMPTSIKWQLPPGFSAGEIIWQKPERFEETGLITYGYKKRAFLATDIQVPSDLKPGSSVTIKGTAKWLMCREACVPGKAELSLTLPVKASAAPSADAQINDLFKNLGEGYSGDLKSLGQGGSEVNSNSNSNNGAAVSVLNTKFTTTENPADASIATILLSAFVGGLILNVMPCVLPVIAIKVMSFFEQAEEKPARVKVLGLTFSAGIISTFMLLAAVVAIVKALGQNVGWGFLFQYPLFVLGMCAVVVLFSLSLFGLFYVNLSLGQDKLNKLSEGEGLVGTFFKGVLATMLSTPCTAPFLGTALGFAFSQSDLMVALIFFVAGLGMASPYLLLTINPAWLKFLPKPGAWMDKFKQSLGFILLGTVAWLEFVLTNQVGALAMMWLNFWLVGLAFCAWIVASYTDLTSDAARKNKVWGITLAIFAAFTYVCIFAQPEVMLALAGGAPIASAAASSIADAESIKWEPFTVAGLDKELSAGKTVFLDFTANWCLTCKVNETTVIDSKEVREKLKALNAVTMKADWTRQDPDITKLLAKFGRSGVPLYVVFPAGKSDQPIVLPEVITVGIVMEKLNTIK